MSAPTSPISAVSVADHCDALAASAVRRLESPSDRGSWGLLKTVFLGVVSFGLIPLLAWSARFRDYARDDSEAIRDLAEWAKFRGRQPAAMRSLLAAAEETVPSPLPRVLAIVLAILIAGVFAIQFTHVPFSLDNLLDATYSHDFCPEQSSPFDRPEFLYRVWVAGLSVGYAVQWLHVRMHGQNVKRFVSQFNPVITAENLPAVRVSTRGWVYFRPLWIMTAVILSMYHAWWSIPMVLAGMAQRRYTTLTAKRLRKELARRMRDVAMTDRSPGFAAVAPPRRCGNPRCLAPLHPHARFCTRCGSKLIWMTNL
jgi:hypothetical protein